MGIIHYIKNALVQRYSCELATKTIVNTLDGTDMGLSVQTSCNVTHWTLDLSNLMCKGTVYHGLVMNKMWKS